MVSPCVPVPFSVNWIKKPLSGSKTCLSVEDVPSSWVHGGVLPCPLEECKSRSRVLHDSSLVLQEGCPRGGWVHHLITPALLGYKILEERTKFTVYKILVTGSQQENWVIFRRYTDFCKLNNKLKNLFPSISLPLPSKSWCKNNFEKDFLEARQIGLQKFLENLILHKDIYSSDAVRHFLCLFNSPNLFDSPDETRAFCETLEETNHRLQRALSDKQREVDALKKTLEKRQNHMELLMKKVKSLPLPYEYLKHPQTNPPASTPDDQDPGSDLEKGPGYPSSENKFPDVDIKVLTL